MAKTITAKKLAQRNFGVTKETEQKLLQLRNYHNKTYNHLLEILVDNAFLAMNEATNIDKAKQLEEQNKSVGFQVQQLTSMFGAYKAELEAIKIENTTLKEQLSKLEKNLTEQSEKITRTDKRISEIYLVCDNAFKKVASNYNSLSSWVNKKDGSFTAKLSKLFVFEKE